VDDCTVKLLITEMMNVRVQISPFGLTVNTIAP
jgi:hypothetical protein